MLIATQHDSVYAFNADTGVTTVTSADVNSEDIAPEIGITGTPVIDKSTGAIYFVTKVKIKSGGTTKFEQRLRALDIATGADKFGGSVVIKASVPGAGAGREGNEDPMVSFDPLKENQRPGLLLLNGQVYIGYASHGDNDPYHGWLLGYDAKTMKQKTIFNASPDGLRAPIWLGGAAPSADASGNIFVATGNGTFDIPAGGDNYGDSILKLSSGATIAVKDYFTPHDQQEMFRDDKDLGSDGVVLLPNNLAITGSKNGKFYVVNRSNLGKFSLSHDTDVQTLNVANGNLIYSTPAVFNNKIYFAAVDDTLKALKLINSKFSSSTASHSAEKYGYPGATPSISSNGSSNGIVWAIERRATAPDEGNSPGPAVLHAYDAGNLSHELFSADKQSSNLAQGGVKFSVPTIANGKVYVGTLNGLVVYGLKQASTLVKGITLVNAATDKSVMTVQNNATLKLSQLPHDLTLRAEINGTVGSVQFRLDNAYTHVENSAPYALFGGDGNTYASQTFATGTHSLALTLLEGLNAKGKIESTFNLNFTLT